MAYARHDIGPQTTMQSTDTWISYPSLHLLLTGIAGDCRTIIKFSRESALNHTYTFQIPPRGYTLAKSIASYLQSKTTGSSRALSCHLFLIDSKEGHIFEINAAGILSEVLIGVAGMGMDAASAELDRRFMSVFKEDEVEASIIEILDKMLVSEKTSMFFKNPCDDLLSISQSAKKKSKVIISIPDN